LPFQIDPAEFGPDIGFAFLLGSTILSPTNPVGSAGLIRQTLPFIAGGVPP
jgi:hypothetical protein